ncbi:hypothetical protein SAMN05421636_1237 [Pricia antarctica]|uniref:Uncharacterized protein n=1 Tax=Pricia antarctica TaxID=641691 RepID=A0A1G7JDJ4_9FLAO|nr:hypothetical protein SAMN05421636_1237 [Pricia antarctica]
MNRTEFKLHTLRKFLNIIIYLIAVTAAFGSILSFFRNSEIRYLKTLDFPRIQFFIVSLISLIAF